MADQLFRRASVRCACGAEGHGPPPRDVDNGDLYRTIGETCAIPHDWGFCARYGHICPDCLPAREAELGRLVLYG